MQPKGVATDGAMKITLGDVLDLCVPAAPAGQKAVGAFANPCSFAPPLSNTVPKSATCAPATRATST